MESRQRNSLILAAVLTVFVAIWFISGSFSSDDAQQSEIEAPDSSGDAQAMTVEVQSLDAEDVTQEIVLQGQTAPNRFVSVKTETAGRVAEVLVERGKRVEENQVVLRLAAEDRPAQVRRAAAQLKQAETDHQAVLRLVDEGHLPATRIDEAFATLEAARAELERIQIDNERTLIRAPFDGILNERSVEVGDFVSVGDPVFVVVDDDPMIVSANVAQKDVAGLRVGSRGTVKLINGVETEGTVRYLSAAANEATRTFPVEIELDNSDGSIASGFSAELRIPSQTLQAHRISPAWLSRRNDGVIGVYLVDEDDGEDRAVFNPIEIVRAQPEAVWVLGLPETAQVISAGQGFLADGDVVNVSRANADLLADKDALALAPESGE